jgi:hypothetical protein
MTGSTSDSRYNKSTNRHISEIKRHVPFIDETFVIASSVRHRTEIKPLTLLEDIVLPKSERTHIQSEMRSIRKLFGRTNWRTQRAQRAQRDERHVYLARKLREADEGIRILKGIYARTSPLSAKLVIQYKMEKHGHTLNWFNSLSSSERKKVKVVHDGVLVDYKAEIKPERIVKLCTQLKPYFSNKELSSDMVFSRLDTIKQKLQISINNSIKNRQHFRRKEAEYKLRKLISFISIVARLIRSMEIYGKTIEGVKSHVKIDGKAFPWPQYLVGNFESVDAGFLSLNSSILTEHSVIIPASGEVPIASFDTLHLFCRNNKETLSALKLLSEHELNKFQAFSHYEISMSREYPLKNSIGFPYFY